MITEGFHGWVMQKRWSGDTSAQVSFFTLEQGMVNALYKSGRTPKKQSLLNPFTPLWLEVNCRSEWRYVNKIEMLSPTLVFNGEILFSALYLNELLYRALQPGEGLADLYNQYEETLNRLSNATSRKSIEVILRRFERSLLMACGYQVPLMQDIYARHIETDNTYMFVAGEGFAPSPKGIAGKHIIAFSEDEFEDLESLKAIKWFMRLAIDHLLDGKPIKARELFAK